MGYDSPDAYKNFFARKDVREIQDLFSLSRLDAEWINEIDNGLVFVEMGIPEPGKVGGNFFVFHVQTPPIQSTYLRPSKRFAPEITPGCSSSTPNMLNILSLNMRRKLGNHLMEYVSSI